MKADFFSVLEWTIEREAGQDGGEGQEDLLVSPL